MVRSIPLGNSSPSRKAQQTTSSIPHFAGLAERRPRATHAELAPGTSPMIWPSHDLAQHLIATGREVAAALDADVHFEVLTTGARCRASDSVLSALSLFTAEAVRNVIQHAHPAGVPSVITIGCRPCGRNEVMVEICDDGVGLPVGFDPARNGRTGYRLMRSIAVRLGAALTFRSSPLGLRLRLRLPASAAQGATNASNDASGLDALLQAVPAGIYATDATGRITYFNRAAVAMWGRQPTPGERWCGSWRIYQPDETPVAHESCLMAVAVREGRETRGAEAVVERPDGSRVPLMVFPTPTRDETGRISGAVNVMVEIGERKRAEQRQQLLASELQHRTKNLFAITRAVVAQSLRGAPLHEARNAVLGRLQAMAETYDKLSAAEWQGAALGDVVQDELGPFAGRVEVEGPHITLNPRAAQNFGLAVHELATNAAKHGSLSVPGGRVTVKWWIAGAGAELRFRWVEEGGPTVTPPVRKGFGSVVLEKVIAQDFGHQPEIVFAPTGLIYELSAGLARVTQKRPPPAKENLAP